MTREPSPAASSGADGGASDRLDSWKDVAAYLRRDVTTVQRWERREGLPIRRHVHDKQGSVYAFRSELERWQRTRTRQVQAEERDRSAAIVSEQLGPDHESGSVVPGHDGVQEQPVEGNDGAGLCFDEEASALSRVPALSGLRGSRRMGLLAGSVAVAVAGISVVIFPSLADRSHRFLRPVPVTSLAGKEHAPAPSPDGSSRKVAVALFENRTGDVSLEPLGQSIAERMIRIVAGVSGAHVVPRPIPIAAGAIGESAALVDESGGSLLVTGTYYVHEDELEFQARIVNTASGRVLHGIAPVTGARSQPAGALQLLEQQLAGAIAIHFDDVFGGLHVVSHPPTLDAYREWRAGVETFSSDYPRALTHFERALQKDPGFSQPLVSMWYAYRNLGELTKAEATLARLEGEWDRFTHEERLRVEYLRALVEFRWAHALRLLEDLERLVPTSLWVNSNLVQLSVEANRPRTAVAAYDRRHFDETLRHATGSFRRYYVMAAMHLLGEYERELQQAELAQQYAPGMLHFLEAEARALVGLGRVADVPRAIDRSLSITAAAGPPRTPGEVMEGTVRELRAHGYREESLKLAARAVDWYRSQSSDAAARRAHRAGLARALYLAERWDEARALVAVLAARNPGDVNYIGYLGSIAARTNDAKRARAIADELSRVRDRAGATYWGARIAALLGEAQRAVDLLREGLAQGLPYGVDLHNDPDLEPLRDFKPFLELIRPSD